MTRTTLPEPRDPSAVAPVRVNPDRWVPSRAGLVNVWQYTNEVLEFDHGRMVLFGPNGSGKTMALELLLPYLLDANGQPARLSTSGVDRGGLWSRVTGYEEREPRTGFLWLEFRRANGAAFTCGVRLRADASGGGEKHWFTTTLRVGHDLALLDSGHRPIGPDRLKDALRSQGTVWGSDTTGYRRAVREALFPGRSEHEVDVLLQTLLVVRKQNVSDDLSPAKLSALLGQALPPLDELELGKVADGFADLDRRRDHIESLDRDLNAVRKLAIATRNYARGMSSRVVHRVIGATTEFDGVTRELKKAQAELQQVQVATEANQRHRQELDREERELNGEREGIEQSEAYREGTRIDDLQTEVRRREHDLNRAQAAQRRDHDDAARAQAHANDARQATAGAERRVAALRGDLEQAGDRMGAPLSADVPDERVEGLLKEWLDDRSRAIRKVRALLTELKIATETRSRAVAERTRTSEDLDVAEAALNGARERRAAAESAWWQDVDTWRTGANELAPHLADIDDPFTARAIVDEALDRAREPLRDRTTLLRERSRTTSNELQRVLHELEQWHAGREPEPEPRAGRRDRAGLEGAPLWRLVDFSPELDASARAGLEAALLESGLLDAWMSSDGSLALPPDVSDVLVAAAAPPRHPPATAPLVPDSSASAINHAAVAALLGSIRWVDRDAHLEPPGAAEPQGLVLGKDGTWRTPHLAGRAPVQPARFIGAASREAARQARIDALERERDELREQLNGIHRELDDVQRRIASCNAQAAAFPSTGALEQATQQVRDAESLVSVSTEALHAATERAHAAEAACKTAQAALMRTATAHGLPTEAPSLDESDRQVDRLRQAVNSLARALDSLPPARTVEARATELALAAQARAHASAEEARTLELELQQASAKLRALREALGASFAELMQRLAEIRKRLAEVHHARTSLLADDRRLERQLGSLEQQCKDTESKRDAAQRKRQSAHDAYVDLCRDGLLGDAELGVAPVLAELHNLTAQLESARKVNADPALPKPPEDAAVTALHSGVSRSLHEASQQLAGRVQVTFEAAEREWAVLRARREGERVSARELRDSIELDRDRAREELDRKQQELFEEILTGSLREHLKLRLWSAQALVDRINTLLKGVRSAAGGVGVSLRWDIDPDQPEKTQLKRAKELLLHDSPAADGRLELDGFLRSRIEQIRADERDTGDWRQRLEQMLDYRAWHRFTVLVHHHRFGEGARELTSRKVALSAGEKTIVMVLPLIAALTAHYEPASNEPPCESPRLLLMDELFPKLDFANKKQLMGLLPQLQLDGVFTSDKDRCEYETLDGIAIHVVQKLDDDKTTTTRMVWNGSMLRVTTGAEPEAPSARLV